MLFKSDVKPSFSLAYINILAVWDTLYTYFLNVLLLTLLNLLDLWKDYNTILRFTNKKNQFYNFVNSNCYP